MGEVEKGEAEQAEQEEDRREGRGVEEKTDEAHH